VITIGAGTIHLPGQAGIGCLQFQDAFGQGAATDISQAYHQNFHVAIVSQLKIAFHKYFVAAMIYGNF
jgi:hypothetical protein